MRFLSLLAGLAPLTGCILLVSEPDGAGGSNAASSGSTGVGGDGAGRCSTAVPIAPPPGSRFAAVSGRDNGIELLEVNAASVRLLRLAAPDDLGGEGAVDLGSQPPPFGLLAWETGISVFVDDTGAWLVKESAAKVFTKQATSDPLQHVARAGPELGLSATDGSAGLYRGILSTGDSASWPADLKATGVVKPVLSLAGDSTGFSMLFDDTLVLHTLTNDKPLTLPLSRTLAQGWTSRSDGQAFVFGGSLPGASEPGATVLSAPTDGSVALTEEPFLAGRVRGRTLHGGTITGDDAWLVLGGASTEPSYLEVQRCSLVLRECCSQNLALGLSEPLLKQIAPALGGLVLLFEQQGDPSQTVAVAIDSVPDL